MPLVYDDLLYVKFNNLAQYKTEITHFISTRIGINDETEFSIGLNGYFPDSTILNNRNFLAQKFGFQPSEFVFAEQVHGITVERVTPLMRGRGAFDKAGALQYSDAWITNHPNICLVAQAADCVPILFFDPVHRAIGAAHAGWKGTVKRIAANVVRAMSDEFGTQPSDLIVGIGPSAGPCCYEVGDDVISAVEKEFPKEYELLLHYPDQQKPVFDLWRANIYTLMEVGVPENNIELAGLCTLCNNHIFFSARCGDRGRFGGAIMLKADGSKGGLPIS